MMSFLYSNVNFTSLLLLVFIIYIAYNVIQKKEMLTFEQRYKSLFSNSNTIVCEVNTKGNITSINKHFENSLKYDQNNLSNLSFESLFLETEREKIKKAVESNKFGKSKIIETVFVAADGRNIPVDIIMIPIIVKGLHKGMFLSGRDLTEQKHSEKMLTIAQKELQDTVSQQQGMIFNFFKNNNEFILSICEGELTRKLDVNTEVGVNKKIKDYFPIELYKKLLPHFELAWEGQSIGAETTYQNITFYTTFRPVFTSGVVTKVIASSIDITKTKTAQEALKNSETVYKKMLDTMNEGVIIYDTDGNIVKANERAAAILGVDHSELLKRKPLEVVIVGKDNHDENFYEMACPSTLTYYEGKSVYNKVFSIQQSPTESIWVIFNSLPIYIDDNVYPEYVIITITDITEQKQQELKIRDVNTHLKTLIENLNSGIMLEDTDKEIIYANEFLQQLLGCSKLDNLLGKKTLEIFEEQKNKVINYEIVQQKIKEIKTGSYEIKNINLELNNGKSVEVNYIPIIDGAKYIGGIWKFDDVTKRKKNESIILSAKEEAERANQAKAKFLSSMSHELRTPLNAIIGFAQIMKYEVDDKLTSAQHENIEEILTAGRHLLKLINDILDFSHIEAGSISMGFKPINIKPIIDETINMLLPIAQKRNIEIQHEQSNVKELYINADSTRLKQVMLNIISNGIKYNKIQGKLNIYYSIKENVVTIHIKDTGVGISQAELHKIFQPFYRTNSVNYSHEGTGIGLSLAKEFVERMNGHISVSSEKGKGSCFSISFQLTENMKETHLNANYLINKLTNLELDKKVNILYIEDNLSNIQLVKKLLQMEEGVEFHYALTGTEGLVLARDLEPEIILLDIHLPDMSGIDVLRKLKKGDNCKVIAISADVMLQEKDLLRMGFENVIKKPIHVESFKEIIKSVLEIDDLKRIREKI